MELIIGVFRSILDVFKVKFEKERVTTDFKVERMKLMEGKRGILFGELKEAHNFLFNISKEFSRDNVYIISSSNVTREEYNQRYLNKCKEDLNRFMAIIATYFPELNDWAEKLDARINVYWGQQRDYLYKKEINCDRPILTDVLNKLYDSAVYVQKAIGVIKIRLNKISDELK